MSKKSVVWRKHREKREQLGNTSRETRKTKVVELAELQGFFDSWIKVAVAFAKEEARKKAQMQGNVSRSNPARIWGGPVQNCPIPILN